MSLVEERLLGRSGLGWINPDGHGGRRRLRHAAGEPRRMRGMRRRQYLGAGHDARRGQAVVDIVGVSRPRPVWRCSVLYQGKKTWQCARASWIAPKRSGKSGRYLRVLNCASEKGLSFET